MQASSLSERVSAAAGAPPLAQMSAEQRAELERELALAESLEDLPGKWQAAVLAAELGTGSEAPAGGCCHHAHGSA